MTQGLCWKIMLLLMASLLRSLIYDTIGLTFWSSPIFVTFYLFSWHVLKSSYADNILPWLSSKLSSTVTVCQVRFITIWGLCHFRLHFISCCDMMCFLGYRIFTGYNSLAITASNQTHLAYFIISVKSVYCLLINVQNME